AQALAVQLDPRVPARSTDEPCKSYPPLGCTDSCARQATAPASRLALAALQHAIAADVRRNLYASQPLRQDTPGGKAVHRGVDVLAPNAELMCKRILGGS